MIIPQPKSLVTQAHYMSFDEISIFRPTDRNKQIVIFFPEEELNATSAKTYAIIKALKIGPQNPNVLCTPHNRHCTSISSYWLLCHHQYILKRKGAISYSLPRKLDQLISNKFSTRLWSKPLLFGLIVNKYVLSAPFMYKFSILFHCYSSKI